MKYVFALLIDLGAYVIAVQFLEYAYGIGLQPFSWQSQLQLFAFLIICIGDRLANAVWKENEGKRT